MRDNDDLLTLLGDNDVVAQVSSTPINFNFIVQEGDELIGVEDASGSRSSDGELLGDLGGFLARLLYKK